MSGVRKGAMLSPPNSILMDPYERGRLDSSGEFTLDVTRARLKLARFYLPPGLYQLRLIQAGVAAGCTKMELHLHGRRQLVYHGGQFRLDLLAKGLQEPLSLPRGSAEAYLAEGILASGSPPHWQSITPEGTETLIGELCERSADSGPVRATLRLAEPADEALLLRRCQNLPIPIEGDLVIPRVGLPEHYLIDQQDAGCRIRVPSSLRGPAMVLWLEDGVLVDTDPLPDACPGARVVAEAQQADLSALRIVRDEVHAQRLIEFRDRVNQLTRNLLEQSLDLPYHAHAPADYLVGTTLTAMGLAGVGGLLQPSLAPIFLAGALLLGPMAGMWAGRHTREHLDQETRARILEILNTKCRQVVVE